MQIEKLLRQILVYTPGVVIPAAMQMVVIIVFTRILDPDAYGRYALVLSTANVAYTFFFVWIRSGQLRFYEAENQRGRAHHLSATMYLSLAVTAGFLVPLSVILIVVLPLDDLMVKAALGGVAYVVFRAVVMHNLIYHRTVGLAARYTALEVCRSVLGFLAAILLVKLIPQKELGLILGLSLGYGVVLTVDLPRTWRFFLPRYFDREKFKEIFLYLWPVIIQMTLIQSMTLIDRYMIEFFLGLASVGLYAVGYSVAQQTVGLVFSTIMLAAYPLLLKEFETEGLDAARRRIRDNTSIVLAVCFPATVGLAMVSGHVATALLGDSFRDAGAQIIPWIALSTFVTGLRMSAYAHVFHLFKRVDLTLKIIVSVVAMNVVLNFALIPTFGIAGAIAATVIADAFALIWYIVIGRRLMPIDFPTGDAWRIAVATVAMAVSLVPFMILPKSISGLTALVMIGATTYAIVALSLDVMGARRHLMSVIAGSTGRLRFLRR